jgi:hypothetical protein
MTNFSVFRNLPAHQKHSETSREAAIEALEFADTARARVYRFIKAHTHGATDEEIQDGLEMPASTERPRRIELHHAEIIEDSGETRRTRSGRRAVVWVLAPQEPQGKLF